MAEHLRVLNWVLVGIALLCFMPLMLIKLSYYRSPSIMGKGLRAASLPLILLQVAGFACMAIFTITIEMYDSYDMPFPCIPTAIYSYWVSAVISIAAWIRGLRILYLYSPTVRSRLAPHRHRFKWVIVGYGFSITCCTIVTIVTHPKYYNNEDGCKLYEDWPPLVFNLATIMPPITWTNYLIKKEKAKDGFHLLSEQKALAAVINTSGLYCLITACWPDLRHRVYHISVEYVLFGAVACGTVWSVVIPLLRHWQCCCYRHRHGVDPNLVLQWMKSPSVGNHVRTLNGNGNGNTGANGNHTDKKTNGELPPATTFGRQGSVIGNTTTMMNDEAALRSVPSYWHEIEHVMEHEITRELMASIAQSYLCIENVRFWIAVNELENLVQPTMPLVQLRVLQIYHEHIEPGSPFEINIESSRRNWIARKLGIIKDTANNGKRPSVVNAADAVSRFAWLSPGRARRSTPALAGGGSNLSNVPASSVPPAKAAATSTNAKKAINTMRDRVYAVPQSAPASIEEDDRRLSLSISVVVPPPAVVVPSLQQTLPPPTSGAADGNPTSTTSNATSTLEIPIGATAAAAAEQLSARVTNGPAIAEVLTLQNCLHAEKLEVMKLMRDNLMPPFLTCAPFHAFLKTPEAQAILVEHGAVSESVNDADDTPPNKLNQTNHAAAAAAAAVAATNNPTTKDGSCPSDNNTLRIHHPPGANGQGGGHGGQHHHEHRRISVSVGHAIGQRSSTPPALLHHQGSHHRLSISGPSPVSGASAALASPQPTGMQPSSRSSTPTPFRTSTPPPGTILNSGRHGSITSASTAVAAASAAAAAVAAATSTGTTANNLANSTPRELIFGSMPSPMVTVQPTLLSRQQSGHGSGRNLLGMNGTPTHGGSGSGSGGSPGAGDSPNHTHGLHHHTSSSSSRPSSATGNRPMSVSLIGTSSFIATSSSPSPLPLSSFGYHHPHHNHHANGGSPHLTAAATMAPTPPPNHDDSPLPLARTHNHHHQ